MLHIHPTSTYYNTPTVFLSWSSPNDCFLRLMVLGQHCISTPNLKGIYFLLCSNRFHRGVQLLVAEFYPPQTSTFIEILSLNLRSFSHPTQTFILLQKGSHVALMASKKQTITHNCALSKSKTNTTAGSVVRPHHRLRACRKRTLASHLRGQPSMPCLCIVAVRRPNLSDAR